MEGAKFKALCPIKVTHERGKELLLAEGIVTKVVENRVYLKNKYYEFSISIKDFYKFNKFKQSN